MSPLAVWTALLIAMGWTALMGSVLGWSRRRLDAWQTIAESCGLPRAAGVPSQASRSAGPPRLFTLSR